MRRGSKQRRDRGVQREWCEVLDVSLVDVGVDVTAAATAGATSLVVDDEELFEDEDRGALLVGATRDNNGHLTGGQVVDFIAFDVDTLTLTLADPLTADLAEDEAIYLYDRARGDVVADLLADVDSDEWGLIQGVTIDDGVADALPPGPRDLGTGEEVLVEYDPDEDEYSIIRTRGLGRSRGRKWEHDAAEHHSPSSGEVAATEFTRQLKHTHIVEKSIRVKVNGVELGVEWYAVDLAAGTITVTLDTWMTTADVFSFHYEYLKGASLDVAAPAPLTGLTLRGFTKVTTAQSSVALPAGTQSGDLVVLLACGTNDGGKNNAVAASTLTDSRLPNKYEHPSGLDAWGTITTLDPIAIATPAGGTCIVATFGDTGGSGPLVATNAVSVTKSTAAGNSTDTITSAPRSPHKGEILLTTDDWGFSHTVPDFAGYTSIATGSGHGISDDQETRIEYWTGTAPSPGVTWGNSDSSQKYDRTLTVLSVIVEGTG